MKRSIHPTQDAFGVSSFYVQLMAMAQVASRLLYGPFTSHEFKDFDLLSLVTPQGDPDLGNASKVNDLGFDIHCCLHEGQALKSCPTVRPDHFQVLSAFGVDSCISFSVNLSERL